jgi:hypothetical protein
MNGIQDTIRSQLTPDRIAQISQTIGADQATTQQAVEAAVPMLMGGMAAHAASPQALRQSMPQQPNTPACSTASATCSVDQADQAELAGCSADWEECSEAPAEQAESSATSSGGITRRSKME